jgi:hypothetical protein
MTEPNNQNEFRHKQRVIHTFCMAYAYLVMIRQVWERAQTFVCYGYNLGAGSDRPPLEVLRNNIKRGSF